MTWISVNDMQEALIYALNTAHKVSNVKVSKSAVSMSILHVVKRRRYWNEEIDVKKLSF